MGEEKPAEWYTTESSKKRARKYGRLYLKTIALLNEDAESEEYVIELGCGIGTLAKLLHIEGFRHYLGIDFSSAMIEEAKRQAPFQSFLCLDLRSQEAVRLYSGCHNFICLETLEHITNDFLALSYIPKGALLLFSLPLLGAKAHVRRFKTQESIYNRYSPVIDIKECYRIKKKWWLCKGVMK